MSIPAISVPLFLALTGVLVLCESTKLVLFGSDRLTRPVTEKGEFWWPLLLSVLLAWWMGERPYSGYGDTINYHLSYLALAEADTTTIMVDLRSEWLWTLLSLTCRGLGMDSTGFFLVVAFGYVLTATWAMKKFVPTSPYLGFLFLISSLFFMAFGVNGLRNGLACHTVMLAMALLMEDRRIWAGVVAFLALGIHRSTMLPIAACIAAATVIRHPRTAFIIWLASIPLSLAVGTQFTSLVSGLGIDSRMDAYAAGHGHEDAFSRTGFRWDFIIYSALPVAFYWYVCIAHRLRDGWYNIIATTYMLANAVWVMMIRIEYTNRFAYLSWFLMPVMIVYPLCNMKVWGRHQDSMAGMALAAYYLFSLIMLTFIW